MLANHSGHCVLFSKNNKLQFSLIYFTVKKGFRIPQARKGDEEVCLEFPAVLNLLP